MSRKKHHTKKEYQNSEIGVTEKLEIVKNTFVYICAGKSADKNYDGVADTKWRMFAQHRVYNT